MIGFFLALGRVSRLRAVRAFVFLYNWIFRATPTLLQLLFIWNALPLLWPVFAGSWFTPFMAAFVALSLNEAAYMCEIIRAGLLSVDPGQELAGRALGMSRRQILRRVIVPQAVRIVIPPTGNEFITLLKLTSLASVISLQELLTASENLASVKFQLHRGVLGRARVLPRHRERPDGAAEPPRAALHVDVARGVRASPRPPSLRSRTMRDEHAARRQRAQALRRPRGAARRDVRGRAGRR